MAVISRDESKIWIGNGTTWGTAVDLTSSNKGKLLHGRLTFDAGFGEYTPRDIGFGNFVTTVVRLNLSLSVTLTCDMSYVNVWPQIVANVMGTSTASPAEQTVSQGDYLHNIDLASSNWGKFQTLAWLVEDDYCLEIPSVKWMGFQMTSGVNEVGTITFNGVGNRIVLSASASNTAAEISAGSYEGTFEGAPLGVMNSGHYARFNAQGGSGLSSGDNTEIMNFSLGITRPMEPLYVLNGASSAFTKEPRQNGLTTGTFSFKFWKIDDSVRDWIADWLNKTELKGELYMDGSAIASGVNRSIKLQLPRMSPDGAVPTDYDLPDNTSFSAPTMTYDLLQASSAPTGQSGVTNYLRMAVVSTRSVTLLN